MCPFKQLQIKKQNNIDCIYMTSLCCEFILSLFWFVEPLKKIIGCGWVFLLIGLALLRTTLCACSRSFWGGAENRSSIGLLIWPAHLFRHFLRRVTGCNGSLLIQLTLFSFTTNLFSDEIGWDNPGYCISLLMHQNDSMLAAAWSGPEYNAILGRKENLSNHLRNTLWYIWKHTLEKS